jgi:hypothetical protein
VKKLLIVIVALAIIGVVVNDATQYYSAYSGLTTSLYQLSDWATQSATHMPQDQFAQELGKRGEAQHIRVTQFSIEPHAVNIWAESDVTGTWVIGPYVAMSTGTPFNKAMGATFVIKKQATAKY